jgi:hypothetical protein
MNAHSVFETHPGEADTGAGDVLHDRVDEAEQKAMKQ